MKFGLNWWDRSIWIIRGNRVKNFPFQFHRPLMERRENFLLRISTENRCCSRGGGGKKKKKERRVNWRMQFWRNSLGVNCSILRNSNNSRTSCIITLIWDSAGLYITGGEFLQYLRSRNVTRYANLPINYREHDQSFDRRRYELEKLWRVLVVSNLFSRDENKDRCNRTI